MLNLLSNIQSILEEESLVREHNDKWKCYAGNEGDGWDFFNA